MHLFMEGWVRHWYPDRARDDDEECCRFKRKSGSNCFRTSFFAVLFLSKEIVDFSNQLVRIDPMHITGLLNGLAPG